MVLRVEFMKSPVRELRIPELVARGDEVAGDRAVAVVHVIQAAGVEIEITVDQARVEAAYRLHGDAELAERAGLAH